LENGHQAEHVLEVSLAQSKDNPVWQYASRQGAVIITKDEDFAEWIRRGRSGPSVVWLRIGNSSKRALLIWIEPLLPVILQKLQQGDRLIELR
jgi:predicted nuclease of predicted toxin-antitoxin system